MKLLTMTLAGLLPVRKIKAGITMSCPVRECHVVFVRSESSHLNSSNKKQYEKKSFQICLWIQSLFSFTLNPSPCQHQCCLRRPCGHQPNNVSHVGIRFYRELCSFFNRSSSFPNIFFAKSHLEGNCETAN